MRKKRTELVFILDRSGSMSGLEADTIGGFNGMLKKQKEEEGEATVTTILFDDQYEILHDRKRIEEVRPITKKQYYVRGCTALLDAIGTTIVKIKKSQKETLDEARASKVIFIITTDGLENASKEYTHESLKKMIQKRKEKDDWEFIFLGANMDAVLEASKFGIDEERAVTYQNDSKGVALNYEVLSDAISYMRCSSGKMGREWKKKIEETER